MMHYSYTAKRWLEPGERVYPKDEFGYWRQSPHVGVIESEHGWTSMLRLDDGRLIAVDGHVVRDWVPAGDRDLPY